MKTIKKLINIVLVFMIIQLISAICFSNFTYASEGDKEGAWETVWNRGKRSEETRNGAQEIINNAEGMNEGFNAIYNGVRLFGIGLFMVTIAATFITLSFDRNIFDKARSKIILTSIIILEILFIFAPQIMGFFLNIFNSFESM